MDQSAGVWWETGLATFAEQVRTPAESHYHIDNTHHHGGAFWITPVGDRFSSIEAVIFAGDPSDTPGDGKTLRESIRRLTVSFLLSDDQPSGLAETVHLLNNAVFRSCVR